MPRRDDIVIRSIINILFIHKQTVKELYTDTATIHTDSQSQQSTSSLIDVDCCFVQYYLFIQPSQVFESRIIYKQVWRKLNLFHIWTNYYGFCCYICIFICCCCWNQWLLFPYMMRSAYAYLVEFWPCICISREWTQPRRIQCYLRSRWMRNAFLVFGFWLSIYKLLLLISIKWKKKCRHFHTKCRYTEYKHIDAKVR